LQDGVNYISLWVSLSICFNCQFHFAIADADSAEMQTLGKADAFTYAYYLLSRRKSESQER